MDVMEYVLTSCRILEGILNYNQMLDMNTKKEVGYIHSQRIFESIEI